MTLSHGVSRRTNWAGNVTFGAGTVHTPSTLDELRSLVARSRRIRALGTAHSFNDLADSPGDLVTLDALPQTVEIDPDTATARVPAGVRYAELTRHLHSGGFALRNLGSLPHISVVGACATGTHGSGVANGCLSTEVSGMELVTADGDLVTLRRGADDHFDGAVVHLGALGVVTAVTLDLVPAYDMLQHVYEDLELDALDDHFEELVACAYSVCLFTDWRGPRLTQVWINRRATDPEPAVPAAPWFTARPADGPRHPVSGLSPDCCTEQLGLAGSWHERLPHFRPDQTPSVGEELQSEYMVDRADAVAALRALDEVREQISPELLICEVRTIAGDGLWMSPCHGRDSVSIHFTWTARTRPVLQAVSVVERQLAPYAARPHWAKIFTTPPPAVRSLYPRLPDFRALTRHYDPSGKFRNAFLERVLDGS
ncbi:D-arabinono-1,4-lactone oxidase [Streptomyces sp. SCL15-4]|uniref:D-arabinono-1,4-lactone oxidase n=1 Tax=Streptomyces sp. SCL15-4 TaxID=2967221 RepID=UPI002966C6EE|nr:D-arabinono-1,4-lactone oxidase [Streptomyces sp. SCL15-4]